MPLVTMNALTKAVQRKLDITEKEARRYAEIVMDMFGYDDCIIDNILDHNDRHLFYRLESKGILYTRREEALLHDGTNWRIRYWVFDKSVIFDSEAKMEPKRKTKPTRQKKLPTPSYETHSIYSTLPETAWTTRKTSFI